MPAYKDEARGTWYASFYYTDWTGGKKLKKKRGFAKKKEAQEYEREFLLTQARSCDMLFENFVSLYYNYSEKVKRNRKGTVRNKQNIIETHILPYFGKKKVNAITPNDIHEWQQTIMESEFQNTYLRTINSKLSAIFNYAVKFYKLSQNPCHQAGSMGSKKPATIDFWTLSEFQQFIPHVKDKPRSHIAITTLYWSGLREGELFGLLPPDLLKYEDGSYALDINKQWLEEDKEFGPPKSNAGYRIVPIPKFVGQGIEEYMGMLYECPDTERIFYGCTKGFLANEITRGSTAAAVKDIRVHDLRHSHVSLLRHLGYSFEVIAKRIGHEDIKYVIDTYNHVFPGVQDGIVDKLESLGEAD